MASKKLTDLGEISAGLADDDLFYMVNVSVPDDAAKSVAVTRSVLLGATYLTTPLTSPNWNGDAKSDAGPTKLDMSAVFTGYPDAATGVAVKAVLLRIAARDDASIGTAGLYFSVGPSATYYYALQANPPGADVLASNTGICPCDANGDIYYKINASGSGTCDCWLEVWGYWV